MKLVNKMFGFSKKKSDFPTESRIKSSRKSTSGFTIMLIPNSSDITKTIELSFDSIMKIFAGALAILIIMVGLIVSMAINNYTLKYGDENTKDTILNLETENSTLKSEVDSLNRSLEQSQQVLAEIENKLNEDAKAAEESAEDEAIPKEVPIKGSKAVILKDPTVDEESGEKEDGVVFTALEGSVIVATASGSVISVDSDPNYENKIVIDHGNGYITTYRTNALIKVAFGDTVRQNDMIAVVTQADGFVAYEITKDGMLIDPYSMMEN